jgi:hypothetical protein
MADAPAAARPELYAYMHLPERDTKPADEHARDTVAPAVGGAIIQPPPFRRPSVYSISVSPYKV